LKSFLLKEAEFLCQREWDKLGGHVRKSDPDFIYRMGRLVQNQKGEQSDKNFTHGALPVLTQANLEFNRKPVVSDVEPFKITCSPSPFAPL